MDTYTSCAFRLETRRIAETDFPYGGQQLSSVASVQQFCASLEVIDFEKFIALLLNSENKLIGLHIQQGTANQCATFPREITKYCLLTGATGVILVHNHPSGSITPSPQDKSATQEIKKALNLFEILLLDHVLISGVTATSILVSCFS